MLQRDYSISHYICPPELGLLKFLDMVADEGFIGVGLTERALLEVAPPQLKSELASRSLKVTSVNSAGYFLNANPEAADKQRIRNAWLIESAAALGDAPLNLIVGGLGQAAGRLTLDQAREQALGHTVAFYKDVEAAGVEMLFEPIHPVGLWTKGCVNSLRQSEDFIRGMPSAAINLDLYHSWWDADLAAFIARTDSPLGLVQICDVTHSAEEGIPRRVPLGEGVMDIRGLLQDCLRRPAIPDIEIELFAFQLPDRDFPALLASTVDYLRRLDDRL